MTVGQDKCSVGSAIPPDEGKSLKSYKASYYISLQTYENLFGELVTEADVISCNLGALELGVAGFEIQGPIPKLRSWFQR